MKKLMFVLMVFVPCLIFAQSRDVDITVVAENDVYTSPDTSLLAGLSSGSDKKVSKDCRCNGKVLKVVKSFPDLR